MRLSRNLGAGTLLSLVSLLGTGCPSMRANDPPCPVQRYANTRCSAVAIGDHVAMTAAHCLPVHPEQSVASITLNGATAHRVGSCTPSLSDDLALCEFDEPFRTDQIVPIASRSTTVTRGTHAVHAGLGCTWGLTCYDEVTWNVFEVNFGRDKIVSAPTSQDRTIETKTLLFGGGDKLCAGDSGGPLCSSETGELIGIASTCCAYYKKRRAIFAALTVESARTWMCEWRGDKTTRKIEGLDCPMP